eukprot:GGOE01053630.1.p1 GENE.GGOE01053630.1~~GGOE01053630.1.p1  ORF type:complete len:1449 (-),score=538.86 GGOE01053630.1:362-4525(-)
MWDPLTPSPSRLGEDPASPLSPLETASFLERQELENEVFALQKQLDILTQVKSRRDAQRGKEGDEEPRDPADLLLAYGLRALLKKAVHVLGHERHPGVLVTFSGLTFKAQVYEGTNVIATFGNQLLKMLTPWRHRRTAEKYILRDLTGSFRPGKTTLMLGPPRSGKSTLKKVIAGRLLETKHAKLQGTVEYGGQRLREKTQRDGLKLFKLVGYVPQTDEHIPTLTTRETMRFAHSCTNEASKKHFLKEGLNEQAFQELQVLKDFTAETTMAILGIRHVGDTLVGNEHLRGISGGQRKRLTTGEILVTNTPVLLADEISTGLDSATTFDICNAFKAYAHCLNRTIVVSLLQPTPETYSTFDEVLVMAAGQIAYHGPRDQVVPYFLSLGFVCPHNKDIAEFLQEVTLPQGIAKYRADEEMGVPWFTIHEPEDFGMAWRNSSLFQQRLEEDAMLQERSKESLEALPDEGYIRHMLTSCYTTSAAHSMWLCLRRQVLLTTRKKEVTIGMLIQVVVVGLILGSLYYQVPVDNYNNKFTILFFSMIFISLGGMALIPAVVAEKNVVYRQTAAHFFSSTPYSVAVSLLEIPLTFIEVLIFVSIMYFMVGFSPNAGNFFLFVLTITLVKLAMGSLFRTIAVLTPNAEAAQAAASVVLMVFVLHSGFFLAQGDVKPWWIWSYWIDPLQYGMTSLSLIEFGSERYAGLRDVTDPSLGTWGNYYLSMKKMPLDRNRLWLGFIYNAGFFLLMTITFGLGLRYVRFPDQHPPQPPPPPQPPTVENARAMPFTPCTLAWHDVCYDVDIPGKKGPSAKLGLRLLSHVSGFAKPGTMTALMGSSGAGKTTLLDVLAGRKNTGKVTGQILLNGQEVDLTTFSRFSGYVEQMDVHSPTATVVEAVMFSALLRLPREVSREEKEASVWKILEQLNLLPIANCQVGDRQSGLSVEQVKRLTIAVEMAANPSVLFLDEPTSGLDSLAADIVMDALKAVTETGRTLICTIHQPSGYLFSMFQHLLLLVRGGKTVFFGETGEDSQALITYFNSIPGALQHDGIQNPATWMLNVIAADGIDFPAEYEMSALCQSTTQELHEALEPVGEQMTSGHHYQATYWMQFQLLAKKWMRTYWRSPSYNLARTFTAIIIALIMGSIFFRIGGNDPQTVFALAGLQFMAMLFMGIMFANTLQGLVAMERAAFYRERASHMYHPLLMNSVAGICEFPYVTLNCLLFVSIFYWMVGMNSDVSLFFLWFLIFWLYVLFYTYFGFLMGCLMPNAELATAMISVFTSILGQMCGFMLPKLNIPWWWRWLYYGMPATYALQAGISTQFYCEAADLDASNFGSCPSFSQEDSSGKATVTAVWVYVRDSFNLVYGDRWMYIGLLVMFVVLARILTGLTLMFVNHAKR